MEKNAEDPAVGGGVQEDTSSSAIPNKDTPDAGHTKAPSQEAVSFLRWLGRDSSLLTAMIPDGAIVTATLDGEAAERAFIEKHNGAANVYYSVNPTRGRLTKKATKKDIAG